MVYLLVWSESCWLVVWGWWVFDLGVFRLFCVGMCLVGGSADVMLLAVGWLVF